MKIKITVSAGEIIDKITILELKASRISDPNKVVAAIKELKELSPALKKIISSDKKKITQLKQKLFNVNSRLWNIENSIRKFEAKKDFSEKFTKLARSVYIQNDRRADLKKKINNLTGSHITEVKEYNRY
jgi:hypothetical protein